MSAPITAGIAYGMKIISREKRAKRVITMSRISAIASETAICSGISTSENRTTNQTPSRNDGIGEGLDVVAEQHEPRAADQRLLEQAQVEREADREHEEGEEDDAERTDEEPARQVLTRLSGGPAALRRERVAVEGGGHVISPGLGRG